MIKSKQMQLGNQTEAEVAKIFKRFGYFAYIIPKKVGGQPFDIIACREKTPWFVDVKHLVEGTKSFPFERIEPNQHTSMSYSRDFAKITNTGFVLMHENDDLSPYFISYEEVIRKMENGEKSAKLSELRRFEEIIK